MKKLEKFRIDEIRGVIHYAGEKFIVCSHGLYSNKESDKYLQIAKMAEERGISCVRFDFRGCGESGGIFSSSVEERVKDLHKVMKFLRKRFHKAKFSLLGSSMGGMVSIRYASMEDVASVITLASPYEMEIEGKRESIAQDVEKCSRILIMHGRRDDVVPVEHAIRIYEKAMAPKKIILFHTNHSFSDMESRAMAIGETIEWVEKYFD